MVALCLILLQFQLLYEVSDGGCQLSLRTTSPPQKKKNTPMPLSLANPFNFTME